MKAKIRNTEIYFDIAGASLVMRGQKLIELPVMFLLHGGPGDDHTGYKRHTSSLQDSAQLVFIDNRGCGRSAPSDPATCTLENNIEDIEALRQYLGLNKIILLGASYGGIVAQGYATRYPEYLERLILVATAPSYHFISDVENNIKQYGNQRQVAAFECLLQGGFKTAEDAQEYFNAMSSFYSKSSSNSLLWSKPNFNYEAFNCGFGTNGFLHTFDYTESLAKINCPTLIMVGEEDWIFPSQYSKVMAQQIPLARLKIFSGCGHTLAADVNQEYLTAIREFLLV